MKGVTCLVLLAAVLGAGCGDPGPSGVEEQLGVIEDIVDDVSATVWPGVVRDDGSRYVRRINGFFQGEPSAYWFAGFASKNSRDVFWFCREGDDQCPLDSNGVTDRTRTVGDPVFSTIPGEFDYSPFWLMWVVRVPPDYQPNSLKSVAGIDEAARRGEVRVEELIFDHGGELGPGPTIMHCLLVLTDTELEYNGDDLAGRPGEAAMYIPARTAWFDRYQLQFYDFTMSEGVFAPAASSDSTPEMPNSDIFVFFRDCEGGSEMDPCLYGSTTAEYGAVSERGVEDDFTGDGDKADANNIIAGFPGVVNDNPLDLPYSPLWRVNVVVVPVEHDADVNLIDSYRDQDLTDISDLDTMREYVDLGLLEEPVRMSEAQAGNAIPGNDGEVFFNCPSQVPAE